MKRISASLLAALAFACASPAACPDGRCPMAPAPVIEWRHVADRPNEAYLYVGGRQVGGFDRSRNQWRDFDDAAGTWGEPQNVFPGMISPAAGRVPFMQEAGR